MSVWHHKQLFIMGLFCFYTIYLKHSQDAKTPGCHIARCVSILSAFCVLAQFGFLQIYRLDPPVRAIEGNVAINTKSQKTIATVVYTFCYQ